MAKKEMKNFISPNSHPSSFLTGSTVEAMIDKTKELDTGYYVCTDNGYLTNAFKSYNYAKKKGLKPILGCELYLVNDCPLTKGWKSEKIKYFTITVHARTQAAYQLLVKKLSEKERDTITILDQEYPLFNWRDIYSLSQSDFSAVIGGPQCVVCKPLLLDEHHVSHGILQRLKSMFGTSLYASIIPSKFNTRQVVESIFTLTNGETVTLDSSIMAETAFARNFRVSLEDVAAKPHKHKTIKRIYINDVGYNVNKDIISALNTKSTKELELDIFEMYNLFLKEHMNAGRLLLNDYAYLANEDDKLVQDLKLKDTARVDVKYFIKTSEEAFEELSNLFDEEDMLDIIDNSYEWAEQFDNFELKYDYQLVKEHDNHLKATMSLVKEIGRFDPTNAVHRTRLKHEIDVIHGNGQIDLLPYFFPISRVLKHYTDNGRVVGPARGSAGGSFLMYCMGITQVDPIKYGLYFSRFLTLGRIKKGTLPDVDVDLPDRELLMGENGFFEANYKDRWAQLSTRTIMKLKSSIRDVNRYKKGKVEEDIEKFAKALEATPQGVSDADFVYGYEDQDGNHIDGLLDKDETLQAYTKERPEEWEIVKRTLGISRQNGRHACGFVLSPTPLSDTIPLMRVAGHENITQYEPKEVEAAGLNKYDFLIVKCLNDIELALKYINKRNFELAEKNNFLHYDQQIETKSGHFFHNDGTNQYIWDLPEEKEVFDMLAEGKTETVFQLNTTSVTPYVMKMMPKSIEDCAVVTSLVRPGPLEFIDESTGRNMAEEYIERVNGRSKGEIPILDELLPETLGVMVFQEQITKMTKELTGWDDEKAEDVRIAVGKKKLKMIEELKPQFIKAAAETGRTDAATAAIIWGMIEKFGRYGFNKSHAVAYSMIAYTCAYLKHHYKLEWWTAVLSNADEKKITEVHWPHVRDILSAPDINLSKEEMVIDYENGLIRNKLSILKGLGEKVANKITENRPYKDIYDFVNKKAVGQSMTRKLIHIGVLDSLFAPNLPIMDKMQLFENAVEVQKYKKKIFDKSDGEISCCLNLSDFIEAAKVHPKTKRCKHVIKEGKIDEKYIFMNPIKDYILKKSVFATMPMNLYDLIKDSARNVNIKKYGTTLLCTDQYGKDVRFINGKTFQNIKSLPVDPYDDSVHKFVVAGYVIESGEFAYSNGERKALKIQVDIDGYIEEMVLWPDYDSGVLKYPKELKSGSVVFVFMYRKMSKTKYHTNVDNIVVEDIAID